MYVIFLNTITVYLQYKQFVINIIKPQNAQNDVCRYLHMKKPIVPKVFCRFPVQHANIYHPLTLSSRLWSSGNQGWS